MRATRQRIVVVGLAVIGLFYLPARAADFCDLVTVEIVADLCGQAGTQRVAEIRMVDSQIRIAGGQFFMEYSPETLAVYPEVVCPPDGPDDKNNESEALCEPRDSPCRPGDPPFDFLLACELEPPASLLIASYAFPDPTPNDTVMARVAFEIISDVGDRFIRFRRASGEGLRTVLTGMTGAAIHPTKRNALSNRVDLRDCADFQNCFSSTGYPADSQCLCWFDYVEDDATDDLDLEDAAVFITEAMAGPLGPICE